MIPEGQNYLENSQWFIVDLRLSRHDEGTYLKLPSLGREIEEQDRDTGRLGSTAENLVANFIHILGVLDSEVNSPRQSYWT